MATIPVGTLPVGMSAPDNAHVYVTNLVDNTVSVIDPSSNTVTATITGGAFPNDVAVPPDNKHVYVANLLDNTVSVVDVAGNRVVKTIPVGGRPEGLTLGNLNAPFASFPAPAPANVHNPNRISLSGSLSLGSSGTLDFANQPMTLTVGGFSLLFPAGTVTQVGNSSQQHFTFSGTLNGLSVTFDLIGNSPNFTYSLTIQGKNVGTQVGPNPVTVSLAIGNNSGSTTVNF
jgi:YVTN family beta-propeller protein